MAKDSTMSEKSNLNFSGHETFAVRHGWLKKVFDAFRATAEEPRKRAEIFTADDAIATFGVGKNMVASMKHWALAAGVLQSTSNGLEVTRLAKFLFSDSRGCDPYLDYPASLWLLHWRIARNRSLSSTWYYAFNQFARTSFEKSQLVAGIAEFAQAQGEGRRVAETTFQRDVDCFISTYVPKTGKRSEMLEDSMECPLAELGLISAAPQKGVYSFDIGPKDSLDEAIFSFAVEEYLGTLDSNTASLDQLTHDSSSPGRVFKLAENDVANYLASIERLTDRGILWRDSAGLRQVQLRKASAKPFELLLPAYGRKKREAA